MHFSRALHVTGFFSASSIIKSKSSFHLFLVFIFFLQFSTSPETKHNLDFKDIVLQNILMASKENSKKAVPHKEQPFNS